MVLALFVVTLLSISYQRIILGLNPCIKPLMFLISITIFLWSTGWLMPETQPDLVRRALVGWTIAFAMLVGLLTSKANPHTRPQRAALAWSLILFGAGGLIGVAINGSNVKIPAHYHGAIVGVTLAFMGLAYHLLPRMGYARPHPRLAALQPALYGAGQLAHVIGLVWSGGYGVQRKVAGADQVLRGFEQVAAMGLMGLGGLAAVAGGLLFIVVVGRSVWISSGSRS
jgi:hypothetical protein